MIPYRDHNPSKSFPLVTYTIVGINTLVFVLMFSQPPWLLSEIIERFALQPGEVSRGLELYTLLTSMFMHGGFGHILGNMLFLHIFGDNLEDYLGKIKYLLFYFLSGLGASLSQIIVDPNSLIPNLGSSGAIAGLMGGYLLLFPKHQIDVLIPFGGFLQRTTVPAFTMLFYWIVVQVFSGFGEISTASEGGVAYFAHIGGFITGVGFIFFLRPFLGSRRRYDAS